MPCLAASDHEGAAAAYLVDALREVMSFGNGERDLVGSPGADAHLFIAMAIAVRFFRWDSRPT